MRSRYILRAVMVSVCVAGITSAANAQGLLDKAKDVAKKTSIGKGVTKLGAQAQLIDATTLDLEDKNFPQVQVGMLKLGISSVEVKNGEAVRLHLYLYNPNPQNTAVPVPPADLFVFVDEKGRRLDQMGELGVKGLQAGTAEINVPAMERVEMSLLYGNIASDAKLATLKIGSTGTITGIPVNTAAGVGTAASSANAQNSSSPWKK